MSIVVATDAIDIRRSSDADLIGQVLGVDLVRRPPSLARLFGLHVYPHETSDGDCDELGLTQDQCTRLRCARELIERALYENLRERPDLNSPNAMKTFLRVKLGGLAHEAFWVFWLDSQHRLLAAEELFRGTLNQTSVYPRELVRRALDHHAASVVLAHNHPSGDCTPSHADCHLTNTIKAALALIDVRVLDHLIVSDQEVKSMAESGLM